MNVKILTIGNIKESFLREGIKEFDKRLKPYASIQEIELKETLIKSDTPSNIQKALNDEGRRILDKLSPKDYVIVLDIKGKRYSSEEFSNILEDLKISGYNDFAFIIGSSYGLSSEIKNRANLKLSFSKMTFPHQLMKLILFEQLYRWIKIAKHEPYHK
ncbi:23S rRNA (pseudouridine(1915)-N(3))-methyltransferase RlmH [Lagierella sp.]|uniref:23S rRNA (pseudouridine(1915)-N(3))-methyltransferase RlmH n=1 Tax=Lagierella sp. TaxID=2849657 RepID=UPI0026184F6A|nr:23S rRNA (pseudouridine(1915)-N(3))-methyltransferase RlmH [Lagierella sp.]